MTTPLECVPLPHYRLIILIIASSGECYDLFAECWREYMTNFPEVKSYFLHSNPDLEDECMAMENTYIYKGNENSIPGIFNKTIGAMKHCEQHFTYDYVLRTNLSTYIHIPRVLKYLSTQSKDNFVAGNFTSILNYPSQKYKRTLINEYFDKTLDQQFTYLHGSAMLFSNDVVTKLILEANKQDDKIITIKTLPDDIAISALLYNFLPIDENECKINERYCPKVFKNITILKQQCKGAEEPYLYDDDIIYIRNTISEHQIYDQTVEARGKEIMNYIKQVRYFYKKPHFMSYIDEVPSKKIVDCFLLYNELDALEYRLSILDDVVDTFILVESTKTFMGIDKVLLYQENKERFAKYNDKIIHIVVEDFNENASEYQANEEKQRNAIKIGIAQLELGEFDYIIMSDVTEIPDPDTMRVIKYEHNTIKFASLRQDYYNCNLNCMVNQVWTSAKIMTYPTYVSYKEWNVSLQKIRSTECNQAIHHGGWHLALFGNSNDIQYKIQQFMEPEYNNEDIINESHIINRIELAQDILCRPNVSIVYIALDTNGYIPPGERDVYPFTNFLSTKQGFDEQEDDMNMVNQFLDDDGFAGDLDNDFILSRDNNSEVPIEREFSGFGNM